MIGLTWRRTIWPNLSLFISEIDEWMNQPNLWFISNKLKIKSWFSLQHRLDMFRGRAVTVFSIVFFRTAAHHGWATIKIVISRLSKIVILAILSNWFCPKKGDFSPKKRFCSNSYDFFSMIAACPPMVCNIIHFKLKKQDYLHVLTRLVICFQKTNDVFIFDPNHNLTYQVYFRVTYDLIWLD